MIKQFTISNLYNFKEEITVDLVTIGKEGESFYTYNKDKISNFATFYGKNNVGKSNLFKIISQAKDFILNSDMHLEPYRPEENNKKESIFEIILEGQKHEIRYGFELLITQNKIIDEWMYAKIDYSSRESLIFSRSLEKMHPSFSKSELATLKNTKDNKLFVSVTYKHQVIDSFLQMVEGIKLLDSMLYTKDSIILQRLNDFDSNPEKKDIFNLFLKSADLDLEGVEVQELSDNEASLLEKMRIIMMTEENIQDKNKKLSYIIEENSSLIGSLISKGIMPIANGDGLRYSSVRFLHRNGGSFPLNQLSSGTRQIVNVISSLVANLHKPTVYLVDELETGLHLDLVNLIISFFKSTLDRVPNNQFLITSHREELLDIPYISKDCKALIKYDKKSGSPFTQYLSQYKLREYHKLSDRYKLDAFDSNPNTSLAYLLNNYFME